MNKDFTDEYYVQDRIDQGEVWSPILWRIFYDALLTRLDELKEEVGYQLEAKKIIDINKGTFEDHNIKFNITAFMDDTTLIGKNKKGIEKMVKICHEFFNINEIKANIGKYELIKINDKENEDLIIDNTKIEKVNN
jgi:hypothetical protein